jgi:hypothetical protein
MENKYCRICWNTSGWRYPTGEAPKLESAGAYVAENGFGNEEWMFNFEWISPPLVARQKAVYVRSNT